MSRKTSSFPHLVALGILMAPNVLFAAHLVTTQPRLEELVKRIEQATLSPGPKLSLEISESWKHFEKDQLTPRELAEASALILAWKDTRIRQILFRWHDLEPVPKKLEHLREIRGLQVKLFYHEIKILLDFKHQPDLRQNEPFLDALTETLREQGYELKRKNGRIKLVVLPVPAMGAHGLDSPSDGWVKSRIFRFLRSKKLVRVELGQPERTSATPP